MSKKQGKSKGRFRHTKKNVLHKKRVNTKKRGLRGGTIDTTPKIDSDGLHGITKQFTFSREKDLTQEVCREWFNKIRGLNNDTKLKAFKPDGTLKTTTTGRKDYDICSNKLNDKSIEQLNRREQLIEQAKKQGANVETGIDLNFKPIEQYKNLMYQAKKQGANVETGIELNFKGRYRDDATRVLSPSNLTEVTQSLTGNQEGKEKTFDTELPTNTPTPNIDDESSPLYVTLTLKGCVAVRTPFNIAVITPFKIDLKPTSHFEYSIYSPAVSTLPPTGGEQKQTLVGTFTQLPVSILLKMAGQERPFSYGSFYGAKEKEERKSYFSDYLSCLENVKQKFGPEIDRIDGSISQLTEFRSTDSSKLRQFGKSVECKIVVVAGNVGIQIQDPVNGDAIFVLPSQLNGAEYVSISRAITELKKYKEDPTAGPLGQLSFHLVVAKFVMDYAARKLSDGNDFTSDFLVINAIDKVIEELQFLGITSLNLTNGYLQVPAKLNNGEELVLKVGENPSENAISIFDSLSTRLKVLQTEDVPTSGLKPPPKNSRDPDGYKEFNFASTTKGTPIYASAVPLNYQGTTNPEKSTLQYCVAGFDLVAQYFGAMVSAYNKSKKPEQVPGKKVKLFLTPVGGGVFNNPREMIACSALLAYYQAQQLFDDFDNSVEVIFLVYDGSEAECKDFIEFFDTKQEQAAADAKAPPEAPPAPAVEIPDVKAAAIEELPEGESPQTLPALEPQPTPLTGDELFEKHKDSSINKEDKDADFESYRKSVVQKFKSEESYYDSEFSELPSQGKNPTDYQLAIVKSVINKNKNLFDKLMELLSLTSSEDLYPKCFY